jgi:hypothetical protein
MAKKGIRERPDCFSKADWDAWSRESRRSVPDSRDHACVDCMPQFKARMMAVGRCSWPCVVFVEKDGGLEGHRMSLKEDPLLCPGRQMPAGKIVKITIPKYSKLKPSGG